jgi:hypothetical protein
VDGRQHKNNNSKWQRLYTEKKEEGKGAFEGYYAN